MKKRIQYDDDKKLSDFFINKKQFTILMHSNPDGDTVGSALALHEVLSIHNIISKIFVSNSLPASLQWVTGLDNIVQQADLTTVKEFVRDSDAVACMDFNEIQRIATLSPILEDLEIPVLMFDHHPQNNNLEGLKFYSSSVSSTCELLFHVISENRMVPQTESFAEAIYTGILTDTGSFSYNSSNPDTFRCVADLLQIGFDKDKVIENIFHSYKENRLRLLGHILSNRMVVDTKKGFAYIYLYKHDLIKYNYSPGDTESFVNYPLSIKGIKMTAFFVEHYNHVKISFRSKGDYAVNELSNKYFNGGGHKNAAGGQSKKSLKETLKYFEEIINKEEI